MPKITHSLGTLGNHLHEWQTLIAALINMGAVTFIAIWVTSALTAATKRTEFFLDFTKRYHEIRVAAHDLDNKVKNEPSPLNEGDAYQIYFRLFGLMYDEMHAYQNKFLEKEVLVDWLTWQMYDYNGQFKIGGVSYENGWQWWLTTPAKYHENTPIMKTIFSCKDKECVKGAVK